MNNYQSKEKHFIEQLMDDLQPEGDSSLNNSLDLQGAFAPLQQQLALEDIHKNIDAQVLPAVPLNESQESDHNNQSQEPVLKKKIKSQINEIRCNELKISRKTSDDLIKLFEQLPEDQINGLLEKMRSINTNTPDFRLKLDVSKLLPGEMGTFSLNDDQSSSGIGEDQQKKSGKKRREKECKCCGQVVKRHQCKHTSCQKPCIGQERMLKLKQKV